MAGQWLGAWPGSGPSTKPRVRSGYARPKILYRFGSVVWLRPRSGRHGRAMAQPWWGHGSGPGQGHALLPSPVSGQPKLGLDLAMDGRGQSDGHGCPWTLDEGWSWLAWWPWVAMAIQVDQNCLNTVAMTGHARPKQWETLSFASLLPQNTRACSAETFDSDVCARQRSDLHQQK